MAIVDKSFTEKFQIKRKVDEKVEKDLLSEINRSLDINNEYMRMLRCRFRRRTFKNYDERCNWMIDDVCTLQVCTLYDTAKDSPSKKILIDDQMIVQSDDENEEMIDTSKNAFSKSCTNCNMANPASDTMPDDALIQCFFCGYQMNSVLNVTIGLDLNLAEKTTIKEGRLSDNIN